MTLKTNSLRLALGYFSLLASFSSLLFFLFVLPTRSFLAVSNFPLAGKEHLMHLAIFLSAFLGCVSLAWIKIFIRKPRPGPSYSNSSTLQNPLLKKVNIALSVLVLSLSIIGTQSSLDIDENIHGLMITRGKFLEELNPIKMDPDQFFTQNHVLAQLASILTIQTFGFSKFSYRAPALAFTLLLLLVIPMLSRRYFATKAYTAWLVFLLCNAFASWYLHSARGYASLMLFTFTTFIIALNWAEASERLSKKQLIVFAAAVLLSPITHFFAMIYQWLLSVGLIFFAATYPLSEEKLADLKKLLNVIIAATPLYFFVLGCNVIFMSKIGDFQPGVVVPFFQNLTKSFGLAFEWQARLAIVLVSILPFLFKKRVSTPLEQSILWIQGTTLAFLGCIFLFSSTKVFEARFFLPFVLPFVWSLFTLATRRETRWWHIVGVMAFAILPLLTYRQVSTTITLNLKSFDRLMTMAQTVTAPVSEHCYFFSGRRDLNIFARELYLSNAKRVDIASESEPSCQDYFHIVMEPSYDKPKEVSSPINSREIWSDGYGMAIYHHADRIPMAQRSAP